MRKLAMLLALVPVFGLAKGPDETTLKLAERLEQQADHWFGEGDFPRAIQALRMRAALDPKNEEWASDLGWMFENLERRADALQVYIQFRENNPTDPERGYMEAFFYQRQRLFAKIPPLLEPILTEKSHPNNYRILANAYDKLGQYKNALRIWDALLKLTPDDATAKANRTRVAKKLEG